MRPAAENLNDLKIDSEAFDILSEAYLDPLVRSHGLCGIGIYERVGNHSTRRTYRGPVAPKNQFEFSNEIQKIRSQSSPRYAREHYEPIQFGDRLVGVLDLEEEETTNAAAENRQLASTAQQLAPLLAWSESSWASRLKAFRYLFDLKRRHRSFDWVGIYRRDQKDPQTLVLSTYIGEPTEHIRIPVSKGICGAAVREGRTINIPNVRADPRFIACSVKTRSELVVPIFNSRLEAIAEIDIDSNTTDAFTPEIIASVEACALILEKIPDLFV